MPHASAETLATLQPVIRALRDIKLLRERTPGAFYLRTMAFVHFHEGDGHVWADLKALSGTGFERYALATPAEQRRFVDEAKRRAAKFDED